MSAQQDTGRLIFTKTRPKVSSIFIIFLGFLWFACTIWTVGAASHEGPVDRIAALCIPLVLGVIFILGGIASLKYRAEIFENGVKETSLFRGQQTLRFADLKTFRYRHVIVNGVNEYTLILIPRQGKSIKIRTTPLGWREVEQQLPMLRNQLAASFARKMDRELQRRGRVSWIEPGRNDIMPTQISLSRDGFVLRERKGERVLLFHEVHGAFAQGKFSLRRRENRKFEIEVSCAVPNFYPGLALAEKLSPDLFTPVRDVAYEQRSGRGPSPSVGNFLMHAAFVAALVVTMVSLSGLMASELRLGAEIALGPAPQFAPGVAQTNVQVAYASSHTLAAWVSDNAMFGALDGAPVAFSESNIFHFGILGIAGGRRNFLVVFLAGIPYSTLLARRVGFDGRILDPVSIEIPIGANQGTDEDGGVAYDGSEFVTVCTRKMGGQPRMIAPPEFVTARVSDDGLAQSGSVFTFPSSQHSVPFQPRIAWTGTSFIVGFGFRTYTDDSTWGVSAMSVEREATIDRTIGHTSFTDFPGSEGRISMAVGADRATFAWLVLGFSATIKVAQTDLDGKAVYGPKALAVPTLTHPNLNYGDIKIAWDGTEYLVAWIAANTPAPGKIQGIRLGYDATPVDAEPFDISPESATTSLSLAPTAHGFVIAYSRADSTNGGVPRAFMRTLERLPPSPRRRAARH